jgi:hypothetical protein
MKRPVLLLAGGALLGIAAWQAMAAIENSTEPATNATAPVPSEAVAPPPAPPPPKIVGKQTPMAERMATLGILNKRNGLYRDLEMKPGQAVRIGDLVVRLKACETTAPWEPEPYTGAFVQVIVHGSDDKWRKIFSGWLFKETPSLNTVQHPIYDVWTKACAMKHPDVGPSTLVMRGDDSRANTRSSAKKSEDPAAAEVPAAAPAPPATADTSAAR